MSYAILQQSTAAPTLDQLKRGFKALKTLTEADAVKLAHEACGILVKNLSHEDAAVLQRALQVEGVATEIVETGQLPKLPDPRFIRRIEFQPQTMVIYDPLGRAVPVEWRHVALVSAGTVRHFGMSTRKSEEMVQGFDPIRGFHVKVVTDVRHKVEDDAKFILDLFVASGAMRFQVEAESFQFKYSFDRPELNLAQKVGLLIRMVAERAPQAGLNRGADALRNNSVGATTYASKAALFDESIWLLRRMAPKT
jgi:hypothetical protein